MPSGQAHTTLFPEMIKTLRETWDDKMSIIEQFDLVKMLNEQFKEIRLRYEVKPPMVWCPNCKKRHAGELEGVTITAMYYSLKRFNICTDAVFKRLMKEWKVYSRENGIDIYGNRIDEKRTVAQHRLCDHGGL